MHILLALIFLANPEADIELGFDGQLCQECWYYNRIAFFQIIILKK